MEQIFSREILTGNRPFSLAVLKEDLTAIYPGFFRYTLAATSGDRTVALFRTNTYEYEPGVPLRAEEVALARAAAWEDELRADPDAFLEQNRPGPEPKTAHPHAGVVIVQASPRAGGNSGTLAQWAEEAAEGSGMACSVLYPHDMDIRECIGCYQCFNTGSCIFGDDMAGIIGLVRGARLLVICTPVYTNTVPANLKILVDRFQAYHAAQSLGIAEPGSTKGVILAVSGRPGQENFACIRSVLAAFMHIAGIAPAGEIFIDGVDRVHDIREIPGCRERVRALVTGSR